jgi:PAS domain S-box-containing protein
MFGNSANLRQRIHLLNWILPLSFTAIAILYQLGLARWVHNNYNDTVHFTVEILFYGTAGPLLAYWTLRLIRGWLDEKEQAERQARASERRLASIISASADAILSVNSEQVVESWNKGAEQLFGYSAREIVGKSFKALFENEAPAEDEILWLDVKVKLDGFVRGHETICRHADGRPIQVELTATGLSDDQGVCIGKSIILRDITSRKRREEEIRWLNASLNQQVAERTHQLAEKFLELRRANDELKELDQMRSEFVSLVSHQIRGPLTNMSGAIERMRTACSQVNYTCDRMFTILNSQIVRLDLLVQDVLNAARIESGDLVLQREPLSILPIVTQVVEQTLTRTTNRPISLPVKPGLPLVYADRDRTTEILANLLDNADKYSPPGGKVEVDISADLKNVMVSVRDHGSGISPEKLPRLFEKFYRTDGSDSQTAYGYGLGLYVCRLLVEALDGHIWAENHPQGGAVFSFTLPLWQGEDERCLYLADR